MRSQREIALITPSHRGDIEQFALLCDSIDRYLTGYKQHYVIVANDDMSHFARFRCAHRVVVPCAQLLPRWLVLAPSPIRRKGRRIWFSLRSKPINGWHVQQILKIAASVQLPAHRFFMVDSDIVFVRPFDVKAYAGDDLTPLYLTRGAITPDAPLHARWTRNCDRLLGQKRIAFPADDYVGPLIVWDKQAVRDMTGAIECATGKNWIHALCNARDFSEYLLYGHFVRSSPEHSATHNITTDNLANVHWDDVPLHSAQVLALVENTLPPKVAVCVQSFSDTPVSFIRNAVGLSQRRSEPFRQAILIPQPSAAWAAKEISS